MGKTTLLRELAAELGPAARYAAMDGPEAALPGFWHRIWSEADAAVAAVPKFSARALRQRAAPPKLVVLSNALLAAADPQGPPSPAADPARLGAWVENACLAHAWNAGQQLRYWREEPLEVDAIVDGSWGSWAIEVKTGGVDPARLRGLAEFTRRHPRYRPLVLCDEGGVESARRAGLPARLWTDFLLDGPGK